MAITTTTDAYVTNSRTQEESHVSDTMVHLFLASVLAAKAADWTGLARKWSDHGYDSNSVHRGISVRFIDVFSRSLASVLVKGAGVGRGQALADLQVEIPGTKWDQMSSAWAQVYGKQIATQSAEQSEKALKLVVPQLMNKGLVGPPLGQMIKNLYGLDPRSMNSIVAFLERKEKPRDRTLLDLTTQLLSSRGKIIGDVQAFTALNFGRQLTYMEAQDQGLLPKNARKVWVTAIDERVCPICRPLDGRSVGLTDFFEVADDKGKHRFLVPPVHPNCRCTIVPENRFKNGLITASARLLDRGAPQHRGKLRQEIEDLVLAKREEVEKFSETQPRDRNGRWVHQGGPVPDLDYRSVATTLNALPTKDKEIWQSPTAMANYLKHTHHVRNQHEADQLVEGVRRWIDMRGVAQVRGIENGGEQNPTTWRGFFKNQARYDGPLRMLLNATSYAPSNAPTLYRGMSVPRYIDLPKKGEKFNLPLSSFAARSHVAANYTGDIPKWWQRGKTHTPVMIVLESGSKSLNISPITKYGKSEWVTKGRFVVTGVSGRTFYDSNGVPRKMKTIYVKQTKKSAQKTFTPISVTGTTNLDERKTERTRRQVSRHEVNKSWVSVLHPRGLTGKFIHASPNLMKVGDIIEPGATKGILHFPTASNDHVHMSEDFEDAHTWAAHIGNVINAQKMHFYEVEPLEEVESLEGDGDFGPEFRTKRAKVINYLDEIQPDEDGFFGGLYD